MMLARFFVRRLHVRIELLLAVFAAHVLALQCAQAHKAAGGLFHTVGAGPQQLDEFGFLGLLFPPREQAVITFLPVLMSVDGHRSPEG